jgi:hypothetical protein
MATSTMQEHGPLTESGTAILAKRDAAVAAYQKAVEALEAAKAKGVTGQPLNKISGAMGGPKLTIENAELALATAGQPFTPWVQPLTAKQRSTKGDTAEQVQAKMDALRQIHKENPHTANAVNRQLKALTVYAAKQGYTVR